MKDKYYYKDGTTSYYYDNTKILHKEDGPAAIYDSGDKFWYIDNKLHRIDGPAVERANGDKYWYIDGKLHRIDGPAVEYAMLSGAANKSWYIDDQHYTEEDFNKLIREVKQLPLAMSLTDPREWVRKLI